MNSAHSESGSNVSGFIRYNETDIKKLYASVVKNLKMVNQDVLEVERNIKNIVNQSGHLEKHLVPLLQALPKPPSEMIVDDEE